MGKEMKALSVFPKVTQPVGDKTGRWTLGGSFFPFSKNCPPELGVSLTKTVILKRRPSCWRDEISRGGVKTHILIHKRHT